MIGIGFALAAALSWGAGDFYGGLASRKMHQFQVLLLTTFNSLMLLILFSIIGKENLLSSKDTIIALFAGTSGALGLATLYKGLSLGNAALVAPVAGVIGAITPILVGLWIEGLPGFITMMGFVLSIIGIWFVTRSRNETAHTAPTGLGLALLAGLGFGGFLALIAQIEGDQIFMPLVFSKSASLILAFTLIRIRKLDIPKPTRAPNAILSGFLDTGGSILYLFSTQLVRLDIAALLSSLYPAGTVLLSCVILKEKISLQQWYGVITCIVAIILISTG